MNRTYRLIWSAVKDCWIVAAETVRSRGSFSSLIVGSAALMAAVMAGAVPAWTLDPGALPTGGQIVAGSGSIAQSGNSLTVNQNSGRMVANWGTFNIGQNASVQFQQPDASSVALNRIQDQNPSQIMGNLTANGQVFLLNPAGIIFGKSAQVDVGGLVASSLNLSNDTFMSGKNLFERGGGGGAIINQGTIHSANGGYVAFLGPRVINEGSITANDGSVVMAAGNKVALDFVGDGLVKYSVEQGAVDALAENRGLIKADGGMVVMTARAADSLTSAVVNNSGVIEAQTLVNKKGKILLMSDMGQGETIVGGRLDASAPNGGDGGFIETSGAKVTVKGNTRITTDAPSGKSGTWLIDPVDFAIVAGTDSQTESGIGADTLATNLQSTNITIETVNNPDNPANGGNGDINVNAMVNTLADLGAPRTLTLQAHGSVLFNAGSGIDATQNGNTKALNVVLTSDVAGSGTGNVNFAGSTVNTNGGNLTVSGATVTQNESGSLSVAGTSTITVANDITLSGANKFTGPVLLDGKNVTLNNAGDLDLGASTARGTLTVQAGGNLTQSGALSVGETTTLTAAAGNITLDNPDNTFGGAILVGNTNNITLTSANAMTLGNVTSSGVVDIATLTGDLTLAGAIATTDASDKAITLNAGKSSVAGDSSGGDIIINGGTVSVGDGGIATLFSGKVASEGLAVLVGGAGSGHFRYNSDESASNYSAPLSTPGRYAIYREQPTLTVTPDIHTISYGDATPAFAGAVGSSYINDDAAFDMVSGSATWTVGGSRSTSGNYIVGSHYLSYSSGLASSLGYGFVINPASSNELTVNQKTLAVTGFTANNKVYDATTVATLSGTTVISTVVGDVVTVGGIFDTKNVGTGKGVTMTIGGADADNYSLVPQTGLTADISKANLNVHGLTANNKVYDTTTVAALNGAAAITKLGTDDVTLSGTAIGVFDTKNVGTGKNITVSGNTISGADSGNYTLVQQAGLTADISKADLHVTGLTANNKIYDGTTVATLSGTAAITKLGADNVTIGGTAVGAFDTKDVGTGKNVTVSGNTISGSDSGNYNLVQQTGLTANITAAAPLPDLSSSAARGEAAVSSISSPQARVVGVDDSLLSIPAEPNPAIVSIGPGSGSTTITHYATSTLVDNNVGNTTVMPDKSTLEIKPQSVRMKISTKAVAAPDIPIQHNQNENKTTVSSIAPDSDKITSPLSFTAPAPESYKQTPAVSPVAPAADFGKGSVLTNVPVLSVKSVQPPEPVGVGYFNIADKDGSLSLSPSETATNQSRLAISGEGERKSLFVSLPNGRVVETFVSVASGGVMLVKVPPGTDQSNNQIVLSALSVATQKLGLKMGELKAVVVQEGSNLEMSPRAQKLLILF